MAWKGFKEEVVFELALKDGQDVWFAQLVEEVFQGQGVAKRKLREDQECVWLTGVGHTWSSSQAG